MPDIVNSDSDEVSLKLIDGTGETVIDNWESYEFNSYFLNPSSHWHMAVSDNRIGPNLGRRLVPGANVQLICNERPIASGRIDAVHVSYSRNGGSLWQISGRDMMGQCVDSCINPWTNRFQPKDSLAEIATRVFGEFGLKTIVDDNSANRSFIKGQVRGSKYTRAKHVSKIKPLKEYRIEEQLKPHDHEGAYEFVARIAKRFGLHIWLSADGQSVVIGQPDFDQDPSFQLVHRVSGSDDVNNNVISGTITKDATDQPSYIVASGFGAGGATYRGNLRVIVFNELVTFDENGTPVGVDPNTVAEQHKGVSTVPLRVNPRGNFTPKEPISLDTSFAFSPTAAMPLRTARPVYLHDDESRSRLQVENFAKRELANRQRRAFTAHYVVDGHTQDGLTWAIDSIVSVVDETIGINENLYVLGLSFHKSRSSGTTTHLELIRPHTLRF